MKKGRWGIIVLGLAIVGTTLYLRSHSGALPSCADLKAQVGAWGAWAPLGFILITVIGGLVVMPRIAILLAGGLIFGFWWGFLWVMVSSMINAAITFYFARYLGKAWVEEWLSRSPRVQKFTSRIEAAGINFVLFCRLIHVIPYTPLNLSLGLLPVSSRDYFVGTVLGVLPGTVPFVYFGTTLGCALLDGHADISPRTWWLLAASLALLAVASAIPLLFKVPGKKRD